MRLGLFGVALAGVLLVSGCFGHRAFNVRIDNQSNRIICIYESPEGPPQGLSERGCWEWKAGKHGTGAFGYCDGGSDDRSLLVTDGPGGEHLYEKSGTCDQWDYWKVTLTIQEDPEGSLVAVEEISGEAAQ